MPLTHRLSSAPFLFAVCQQGAEKVLKTAWLENGSALSLAFSRPGLVTFKLKQEAATLPQHLLARQVGWSLGQVQGESAVELVAQVLNLAGAGWDAIHIFERDQGLPGVYGFEPTITPLCESIAEVVRHQWGQSGPHPPINQTVAVGSRILDLVLIESHTWLVGFHQAETRHGCWPGGAFPQPMNQPVVSRAYYKMAEAVAWSGLPIQAGDAVVELGSSPGGASQRLLDLGLRVTGVDPAEMDPDILQHPRFEHWRSKSAGLKRKLFRKFNWLAADANVAPNYTLDMVEDIVTYPGNEIEGMMLTFKLSSYDMLAQLPALLDRIRSWGYPRVEARQLATNRQECCVVAERSPKAYPADEAADVQP
jgi:23S rRNA (cytidine2498-2'-O)-methyltransferase